MVIGGHQKVLDEVLLDGLHSLDPLAAPVLALEVVHGHPLDIAQVGHGDHCVVVGDQILHGNVVIKADLCPAVIPVFVRDHQKLLPDHA